MPSHLSPSQRTGHYVAGEATTIEACLKKHFKLQRDDVAALFRLGAVYKDKKRVFENLELKVGDYIRVHLFPKRFPVSGIKWRSHIFHDAPDFLIVDKPAGIPVHATVDNRVENVLEQMRSLLGIPLFVTHRLDTPVRGLVVFGKTPKFQARFNRLLLERKVDKRYLAITEEEVPTGRLIHYMEPAERAPRRMSKDEKSGWQRCELTVHGSTPFEWEGTTLWRSQIELHTGRTHQIRAQLSHVGFPLLGDAMYGSKVAELPGNLGGRDAIGLISTQVKWDDLTFELSV